MTGCDTLWNDEVRDEVRMEVDKNVRMLSSMRVEKISKRGFLPHPAPKGTFFPRDTSSVPALSWFVCPSVAPERNFPYG
jgi:hypothetical protein